MADAPVLGAGSPECGFKSHLPHHVTTPMKWLERSLFVGLFIL